jgi:drug/metabolite transporter (DMT)-like permease
VALGFILFNESPGIIVLAGMAVIIIAAAIPYIKDYNVKSGKLSEN